MSNLSYNISSNKGMLGFFKSLLCRKESNAGLIELTNSREEYMEAVREARLELENAERIFNYSCDPDLVEYAIYKQNAEKLRFSYLIKKAKEKNIRCDDYISY